MLVLAVCGSLRRASLNHGLLRAAARLAPEEMRIEIVVPGDLPLLNEDLEPAGWPAPVRTLRELAYAADGILFGCPEYNSLPAAPLKNALDWLSRPEGAGGQLARPGPRNPLGNKPCAIVGATPGMGGTIRGQSALRMALHGLGALSMPAPDVYVSGAAGKFDGDGDLLDQPTQDLLATYLRSFAAWVVRVTPAAAGVPRSPLPQEAGGPRQQPGTGVTGRGAAGGTVASRAGEAGTGDSAGVESSRAAQDRELDTELADTFPASDPPSLTDPNRGAGA